MQRVPYRQHTGKERRAGTHFGNPSIADSCASVMITTDRLWLRKGSETWGHSVAHTSHRLRASGTSTPVSSGNHRHNAGAHTQAVPTTDKAPKAGGQAVL